MKVRLLVIQIWYVAFQQLFSIVSVTKHLVAFSGCPYTKHTLLLGLMLTLIFQLLSNHPSSSSSSDKLQKNRKRGRDPNAVLEISFCFTSLCKY